MSDMERVGQLLSAHAVNTPQNNVQVVQPLAPPAPMDLLSANIVDYRDSKEINGFKAYRYACHLRAQTQGLNLPPATISLMASNLWVSEQTGIKNAYIDIARQAAHIYELHNGQLPTNECEGCASSNWT